MYVRSLSLTDFRNIEKLSLTFTPNFNIIFGNNAQGKTNTVEAICLALSGKSHRENLNANFIRFGQEACLVNAEVSCDDFTTVNSKVNVGSKGRTHFIDSERVRSSQTLLSFFSYVFFSPEDLRLVKDSPVLRRNFTDESISVLYPSYAKLTGDYKKTLRQRSILLKAYSPSDSSLLDIYDDNLALIGSEIIKYRLKFLKELNDVAARYYKELSASSESISLSYYSNLISGPISPSDILPLYRNALKESRRDDILSASTTKGIHHDDVNFFIEKANARKFASQGQQRSIAVSLKMAVCDMIKAKKSQQPIVLLDDVMSELDENRRSSLVRMLNGKQVFITCTEPDFESDKDKTFFFKAENGKLEKID